MNIAPFARRTLRGALSGAFFLAYGALGLAFAPFLLLPVWPPRAIRGLIRFFYRAFVALARATSLFAVEMDGATRARLASARGCVIAMNHISLIDIVVLMAHLPDSTAVAKAATRRNPVLWPVVKRMFIVNDESPERIVAEVVRFLSEGVDVIVFPQGTRGGMRLHRGAARFALAARAPLIPVRIAYDPTVLAKGQPWWDVGERTIRIRLEAGAAIPPEGPCDHATAAAITEKLGRFCLSDR